MDGVLECRQFKIDCFFRAKAISNYCRTSLRVPVNDRSRTSMTNPDVPPITSGDRLNRNYFARNVANHGLRTTGDSGFLGIPGSVNRAATEI